MSGPVDTAPSAPRYPRRHAAFSEETRTHTQRGPYGTHEQQRARQPGGTHLAYQDPAD